MHTNKPSNPYFLMRSVQLLCLLAVLFSSVSIAQSEDPLIAEPDAAIPDYFRIELIVYKVLDTNGDGNLSYSLSDYTDPIELEELSDELQVDTIDENIDPRGEIEIQQSEVMENAWKRLRNSRNFRPLKYSQWNELRANTVARHAPGGVEGTATRIHGDIILSESRGFSAKKTPLRISPAESITELIEIEPTYKLDGKASFGQGRFLHISLDFEYRDWSANDFSNPVEQQASTTAETIDETVVQGPAYVVYGLKKTRQIVPLKPELFDNEQFGVLVYLEAISPMDVANSAANTTNNEN